MDEREACRRGYPLTIPDALLKSQAMRRACAERDFPEIFRLVNRRTGSSHAVMAAAVGKMTSSRVSDIIRGVRGIRGHEVMERVADGFGIPGEMLGLPARPWQLFQQGTESRSAPVSAAEVVLVAVRIDGKEQLMPVNRRALLAGSKVLALPGGQASTAHAGASQAPSLVGPVCHSGLSEAHIEATIDHLGEMWHVLVRTDNLFGPRHALNSVLEQLSILVPLLDAARDAQRVRVLSLAAKYAESAAWLHEDCADMAGAIAWTAKAMEWAAQSGDDTLVSWTLFRQSQQATADGNARQTIGLANAMQRRGRDVLAPAMRAAAIQQEAQGHALGGDEISCHRRLDAAHDFAASPDTRADARSGHGDFCTSGYIEIQRANCWMRLSRPELAVPIFERELSRLPEIYRRDRGLTEARLARAFSGIREYEQATRYASSALHVAQASGSTRTMIEAVSAVNAISAEYSSAELSELFETFRELPEYRNG